MPALDNSLERVREIDDPGNDSRLPASIPFGILLAASSWFVCRVIVSLTWAPARNPFSINTTPWFQWDSGNYLSIASHGITFGRCGGPGFPESSIERWLNVRWCGTAGWLPGYSWLVSALHLLGFSLPLAGLLLSWVAMAAAMFLIWFGWARDLPPIRSFLLLMLFGLFPGAVYSFAIFPLSIALLCIMGSVFAATRERFFVAALFMVFGGLCYPSAWFAAAGLAIGLVLVAIPFGRSTMVRRGLWGVAGLASLPILGLLDWSTVGTALAYFKSQSNYNSGAPGMYFFRLLFTTKTRQQQAIGRFYGEVLAFQALLAAVITGYAACSTSLAWRRGQRAPLQIYPAVVGASVAMGLVVLGNAAAWNRSIVLAAPCIVCLRKTPMPWLVGVIAVVGVTTLLISRPFFLGLPS